MDGGGEVEQAAVVFTSGFQLDEADGGPEGTEGLGQAGEVDAPGGQFGLQGEVLGGCAQTQSVAQAADGVGVGVGGRSAFEGADLADGDTGDVGEV